MNILALAHAQGFGGAQVSALEFFELMLSREEVSLRVAVCDGANKGFIEGLKTLGIEYRLVPCTTRANLPAMDIHAIGDWLEWADVAWISDIEFLVAPKVKRLKRIPVISHLHSYPLLCPVWWLIHGMREVCQKGCSMRRIVRCKQLFNEELFKLGILGGVRNTAYGILDYVKGPLDYSRWRRALTGVVDSVDGFVAVSNFVKKVHETLLPIEDKPIDVVYNPVTFPLKYRESHDASSVRDEGLIVYASGSSPLKGPHLLLKALKILVDGGMTVKLAMIGCKGSWVERYASRLGVKQYIKFADVKPLNEVYKYIAGAKVVIMPSICPESFGRIPVEANRLGVPCVATRRGGLSEVISPGETGFLVNPSAEDVAESILEALNLKWRRSFITAKSLEIVNPEKSIEKLIKVFESIVG